MLREIRRCQNFERHKNRWQWQSTYPSRIPTMTLTLQSSGHWPKTKLVVLPQWCERGRCGYARRQRNRGERWPLYRVKPIGWPAIKLASTRGFGPRDGLYVAKTIQQSTVECSNRYCCNDGHDFGNFCLRLRQHPSHGRYRKKPTTRRESKPAQEQRNGKREKEIYLHDRNFPEFEYFRFRIPWVETLFSKGMWEMGI